jgi:hypothetical protein
MYGLCKKQHILLIKVALVLNFSSCSSTMNKLECLVVSLVKQFTLTLTGYGLCKITTDFVD